MKNWLIIFSTIGFLGGCSSEKSPLMLDPVPGLKVDSRGWSIQADQDANRGVRLERLIMPAEQQAFERTRARQTNLVPFPVESRHNVNVFQIKSRDEWKKTLFLAPRIMAFGAAQGGRLSPKLNDDGTVSLSFPVALIDGSVAQISSLAGSLGSMEVPSQFLIQDLDALKKEAAEDLGFIPRISSLPGCPKRIILRAGSQEYDATPIDLDKADYCQANTPFIATLRIPTQDARYLLERALYAGTVEVRATYETVVALPVSQATISFDKDKLFESLEAELKISGGVWFQSDLKTNVKKVVDRQALKISIQGDVSSHLDKIVEQAINEFFKPYRPEGDTAAAKCTSGVVCFNLNYAYSHESREFSFSWQQTSNEMTGQTYVTWARLAPMDSKTVNIGDPQGTETCLKSKNICKPDLKNDGSSMETGLTVMDGDLLELKPNFLIQEERSTPDPTYSRQDNNVCVSQVPRYVKDCDGEDHCHNPRFCRAAELSSCRTIQDGFTCTQTQNQWQDTYQYSLGAPVMKEILQPNGQSQSLYDGMVLRFTWGNGQGGIESVSCKLSSFQRDGDGVSMLIRLQDRPDCPIFSKSKGQNPMLSLVNNIHFKQSYQEGREVRTWDGRVLETPRNLTFDPQIRFGGTVSIRGYEFGVSLNGRI